MSLVPFGAVWVVNTKSQPCAVLNHFRPLQPELTEIYQLRIPLFLIYSVQ